MDIQGMKMFYDVCRLCLERRGVHCMFENEELPEHIFACIGVKVKSSDNLPRNICNQCFETINNAKELRKLAINNDKHLRLLFDEDNDSDDELGRLVIDEKQTIKTRPVDSPRKSTFIGVRKDLFPTGANESSVSCDSSSKGDEITKIIPKREKTENTRKSRDPGNNKFQCETCKKEFTHYKKLYLHERLHNKNINCPIDVCPKKFATKGDLIKHLRVHTGEKPFGCNMCKKTFAQRVTLRQHKETVHEGIEPNDET